MLQASRGRGNTAESHVAAVAAKIRVVKPALHDARSALDESRRTSSPQPRRGEFAAPHVEPQHIDADLRKAVAHRTVGDQARHRTVPAAPHSSRHSSRSSISAPPISRPVITWTTPPAGHRPFPPVSGDRSRTVLLPCYRSPGDARAPQQNHPFDAPSPARRRAGAAGAAAGSAAAGVRRNPEQPRRHDAFGAKPFRAATAQSCSKLACGLRVSVSTMPSIACGAARRSAAARSATTARPAQRLPAAAESTTQTISTPLSPALSAAISANSPAP